MHKQCLADCQCVIGFVRTAREAALRDADFDQNRGMATDGSTEIVTGDHASYRGEVHCPIDDGMIEFTVTGPDYYQAALYKEAIIRKF
jgi:hypothetical protein